VPALAPVAPETLKRILELKGYRVVSEDDLNWALARDLKGEPVIIPKAGELVALDVMSAALDTAQMSNSEYFRFRTQALGLPPIN